MDPIHDMVDGGRWLSWLSAYHDWNVPKDVSCPKVQTRARNAPKTVSQAAQPPSGYSSSASCGGGGGASASDGLDSFGAIVRGDDEPSSSTTVSVTKLSDSAFSVHVTTDNRWPFSRSGSTMALKRRGWNGAGEVATDWG